MKVLIRGRFYRLWDLPSHSSSLPHHARICFFIVQIVSSYQRFLSGGKNNPHFWSRSNEKVALEIRGQKSAYSLRSAWLKVALKGWKIYC